ncbi:N-acetylglucosamine-specific PTS transporter subunit IIBC [uncultured Tyzzerella sp.]|uniref:N-acetylglucosamine-specific PTS transporter subunit IIBC n=1 Tax=uncultured Tyzzerella sp. TaxID=2321398 RepID=UPI0029437E1E|nr:N-acetylglucosamine-specific PTS transporter subunit IIBC [uncultured Tyzzerella sp.]
MMKYFQRLGKSLMLPVACLPIAGILMGLGYMFDKSVMAGGDPGAMFIIAKFLVTAGGAIINSMGILFAIGISVGMSDDQEGTSALAGLVSFLIFLTVLEPSIIASLRGIDIADVNPAFTKMDNNNQFIGIISGIIGASCYNKFKNTKLPDALAFFSGKRSVAIVTGVVSLVVSVILFFIWPILYTGLVKLGTIIVGFGAGGAGVYGFLNRLLIPVGLHHALNSVFWFDIANVNDLGRFWAGTGTLGETGMYMTGFFPVMMFGLPAGCLAMYHTAKDKNKKIVSGLFFSSAICSFFTGVTEPIEFAFMFLAPGLYLIHAILTGLSLAVLALLPVRAGFNFSAGFLDLFFSSFTPLALNPWMLLPIGLVVGVVYYFVFRFAIKIFNFKTPGREDELEAVSNATANISKESKDFVDTAKIILEGLGGKENIVTIDNCITRLRIEVKDITKIDENKIRLAKVSGILKPGKNAIQIVIGTNVQFVADELKKIAK